MQLTHIRSTRINCQSNSYGNWLYGVGPYHTTTSGCRDFCWLMWAPLALCGLCRVQQVRSIDRINIDYFLMIIVANKCAVIFDFVRNCTAERTWSGTIKSIVDGAHGASHQPAGPRRRNRESKRREGNGGAKSTERERARKKREKTNRRFP